MKNKNKKYSTEKENSQAHLAEDFFDDCPLCQLMKEEIAAGRGDFIEIDWDEDAADSVN